MWSAANTNNATTNALIASHALHEMIRW